MLRCDTNDLCQCEIRTERKTLSLSAAGMLMVHRPIVEVPPLKADEADRSFKINDNWALFGMKLQLGEDTTWNQAMRFRVRICPPSTLTLPRGTRIGKATLVQVIEEFHVPGIFNTEYSTANVRDGSPHYEAETTVAYTTQAENFNFADSPRSIILFARLDNYVIARYNIYVIFCPGPGDNNIWVSLGKVTWSCDGEAIKIPFGPWSLLMNEIIGPSAPDDSLDFPFYDGAFNPNE